MKRKTDQKGWMAIKIDLEKAYDKHKWILLETRLWRLGCRIPLSTWFGIVFPHPRLKFFEIKKL